MPGGSLHSDYVLVSTAGYEDNDGVCVGRWLEVLFTQTKYWLVLQVMKTMMASVLVGGWRFSSLRLCTG